MTDDFGQLVTNFFKNDYRERGKVKWNGYFLSDHTSSLKQETLVRQNTTRKLVRMPRTDIKNILQSASLNYKSVTIQEDFTDKSNEMLSNTVGFVTGFSDRGVVINKEHILFENMRAVKVNYDND